jgi:hypothetical protein
MHALLKFVDHSYAELAAAERAVGRVKRIEHLERAYCYARLAVEERKVSNLMEWPASRA